MAQQAVFYGPRPDAVARAGDDVVVTANELNETLAVAYAAIAGNQVLAREFFPGGFRILPLVQEHDRIGRKNAASALSALGHRFAEAVDGRPRVSRTRLAHRADDRSKQRTTKKSRAGT